jgi:DNA invertase Pin-like site-specific DNA recombinase
MSTAAPAVYISAGTYTIAAYLRISHEDGNDESNSITNQRDMIRAYIVSRGEFANARIVDYVDDGQSGESLNRRDYQRLMADAERGAVNCIIVKDLSRIGRNMIDTGDLLMNYLVARNVRFIAINNNYDSFLHPLSNLELAIINLANQHYNRDLAQKSVTSKLVKMKRGEYLSCWTLFGYMKSETEKNKIVIDAESAEYVRLMFSLAMDGNGISKIAVILNAQGIPTPHEYKKKHGVKGGWKTADPDYSFWYNTLVGRILNDIRYTGVAVNNMYKIKHPGTNRCLLRPREEWIIVPDAHEAIISETDYKRAHDAIRRERLNDAPVDHIFYGKVKCPVCGHTMRRANPLNPRFKCGTGCFTDHYGCPDFSIAQADIEKVVLASAKAHAAALVDREEIKLETLRRGDVSKAELEKRIRAEENNLRLMEESVTKNFTLLVSGKLTKEAFVSKKETINATIARKNAELERLRGEYEAVTAGKNTVEGRLSELRPLLTVENLDRELVDLLIDKILVHGEQEIEIVWAGKFD